MLVEGLDEIKLALASGHKAQTVITCAELTNSDRRGRKGRKSSA